MAKKEIEQTEIEAPYELPEGWKWENKDIATRIRFYYVKSVAIVREKIKWQRKK